MGTQSEKDHAAYDAASRLNVEDLEMALSAGANARTKINGASALQAAVLSDVEDGDAQHRSKVIELLVGISNLDVPNKSQNHQ